MSESEITEVYSAADEAEAFFLKNMLEDADIKAHVVNDKDWIAPGAGEAMSPHVWVSHADAPRAREIILRWEEEHERQAAEETGDDELQGAAWTCPGCGEEVQADFEVCWNCERPRDAV